MAVKGVSIRFFEFTVVIEKDESGVRNIDFFVQESDDPDKYIRVHFNTFIDELKEFLREILRELEE